MPKAASAWSDMSDTPNWFGWDGARASLSSGRLNVSPAANTTAYTTITMPGTFDLTDCSGFAVEVVQATSTSSGCETAIEVTLDSANKLSIIRSQTSLLFRRRLSGSNNDAGTVTYNNTTHRFWRIRETAGTTYWETSPDGMTWTSRRSESNPFALTSVTVALNTGTWQGVATPGTAIYDNLNLPRPNAFFGAL